MKTLLLMIALLLSFNLWATDFLNSTEKGEVLTAIDNICADTWCEGDYDFSFDDLYCSKENGECTLSFNLIYIIWDVDYEHSTSETFHAECTVSNLHSLSDILYSPAYEKFSYYELTQEFYEQLSDCISQKEQEADNYFSQTIGHFL
jgi:hypothetical protein